ncbi:hypothetical protein M3Y97_00324100 [Aphelenchoides bicaudatus]|nr:hypothetical protein M3Y97_00324100 [Aphelenchoides bicaudatus]
MLSIQVKIIYAFVLVLMIECVNAGKKEDCLEKKCSDATQRQKLSCQTFCQQNPTRCKNEKPKESKPEDCTEFTSEKECVDKTCVDVANGREYYSCQQHCADYWKRCGVD